MMHVTAASIRIKIAFTTEIKLPLFDISFIKAN